MGIKWHEVEYVAVEEEKIRLEWSLLVLGQRLREEENSRAGQEGQRGRRSGEESQKQTD